MIRQFLWDPWHDLDRLHQEVNRLFARVADWGDGDDARLRPAMTANETDDGYRLSFDVPGVSADRLTLEVEDRFVHLRGERESPGYRAHYERTVQLPESADVDGIQAELRDGVLSLFVPKRAHARPRRIEISTAKREPQQIDAGDAAERAQERELVAAAA